MAAKRCQHPQWSREIPLAIPVNIVIWRTTELEQELIEQQDSLQKINDLQSLRDKAYLSLRAAILSLSLKPGQPLIERALAAQLGISKTPIRGALVRLEKEGLVTMTPFRGAIVAQVFKEDVRENFQIREVLEGLAVRLATPALPSASLVRAERSLKQAAEAFSRQEYGQASQFGHGLHDVIIEHCGNQQLQSMIGNLDAHLQRFRLLSAQIPGRLARSAREHEGILDALNARDAHLAEQLMRAHLAGVLADLLSQESLQGLPERE